jgi:sterol 3beta-glucosyltransferase
MRALLLTVGSQGDVQPFAALAARLRASGHEAVLAAPALFGSLAAAHGVPFVPLEVDLEQIGAAVAGRRGLRHLLAFCRAAGRTTAGVLPALTAAARPGADVIVHHPVLPIGPHLAEFLGVPAVAVALQPALLPTGQFASAAWPCRVPAGLNRASYPAARWLAGAWARPALEQWRRDELALPPRPGRHDPLRSPAGRPGAVLHAFSAHVVPRPDDWPATAVVTGYWPLPSAPGWSPPRRLAEFVADGAGQPVVYLGFGSMPGPGPARLADAIVTAADRSGMRAVVASASPELRRLLPAGRFLVIRQAPHDWLFPRVQAIVHHGGAGTTGAAVMAGRPQVIWPFGIDQPFWARRMAALGVAPAARPVQALTGPALTAALDQVLGDQRYAGAAADLARLVAAEDGLDAAVGQLERVVPDTNGVRPAVWA